MTFWKTVGAVVVAQVLMAVVGYGMMFMLAGMSMLFNY